MSHPTILAVQIMSLGPVGVPAHARRQSQRPPVKTPILFSTSRMLSIISIGRNPLAKHAIYRSLGTTFGMVLAVAVVATVLIMFLLR